MEEPQHSAVVQGDPNAEATRVRHAGNRAARVTAHGERVLDVERVGIQNFNAIVAPAPQFPGDGQHFGHRRRYRPDGYRRWIRSVPSTGCKKEKKSKGIERKQSGIKFQITRTILRLITKKTVKGRHVLWSRT